VPRQPPRELDPSEWLTQYGNSEVPAGRDGGVFRDAPRSHEQALSTIVGQLAPDEACELVRQWGCPDEHVHCVTRWATVGALRRRGFLVEHSPTIRIPGHTNVSRGDLGGDDWPPDVSEAFNSCFD